MGAMRLFAALVPPDPAIEDLDDFLAPRREHGPFRWTLAEHFHVTLAFMADAPDRALDDVIEALAAATAKRTSFRLAVAGGTAFPDPARAKVLVAGLAGSESALAELDRLAVGCRNAAAHAGCAVDGQRFRPHLTVARTGRPAEVTRWVRLLDSYRGPQWGAERVVLLQSHLGEGPRRRPRYEALAEFPLSRAPISS